MTEEDKNSTAQKKKATMSPKEKKAAKSYQAWHH
jgi:hypothetical protein